jgi:hypothetical protein
MNDHEMFITRLPEYVAGSLSESDRSQVEQHVSTCPECQEDLRFWQLVSRTTLETSGEPKADPKLLTPVVYQMRKSRTSHPLQAMWQILRLQLPIVHKEIWPASLLIILIGYIASVLVGKEGIFLVIAPIMAASSIAILFGAEHDPATELSLSTPVSPAVVLLARLVLVFSFNFAIACTASVAIVITLPGLSLAELILSWLAPMSLLSSLALLISIQFRSETALITAYCLWLIKVFLSILLTRLQIEPGPAVNFLVESYLRLWNQSAWAFSLSLVLCLLSFWLVKKYEYRPQTMRI